MHFPRRAVLPMSSGVTGPETGHLEGQNRYCFGTY